MVELYPSVHAAAVAAGKSNDQLMAYRKGENEPPFGVLAGLAGPVGVSLDWLATGAGEMKLEARESKPPSAIDYHHPAALRAQGYVLVPRYEVRAAAGAGAVIHSERIVDWLAFREEWVRTRLRLNPQFLFTIEAHGDSMEPAMADGDILLIDGAEDRIRDNAVYVLVYGGDLVVKRIERRRDGSVVIKSDNPAYAPEVVPPHEVADLRVVGRVCWHGGLV